MQAILVAGKDVEEKVKNDKCTIIIRLGHRNYKLGQVLIGCHIYNWGTIKEIISVTHTTIYNISYQDILDYGHKTRNDLIDSLKIFYPDIDSSSEITVVRWK